MARRGPCGVRCRAPRARRAGRPASRVRARRWLSLSRAVVLVVLVDGACMGIGRHESRVDRVVRGRAVNLYSFTYAPGAAAPPRRPPRPHPVRCDVGGESET